MNIPYHDLSKLPHLAKGEATSGGKVHQTKEQDGKHWALVESEVNDPSVYWLEVSKEEYDLFSG